ncbi:MAG: hypothetical protein VX028_01955 [Nanoarchaeota archaeon]|nr:hypothetical protein [Nanoarchaeota archaeon]
MRWDFAILRESNKLQGFQIANENHNIGVQFNDSGNMLSEEAYSIGARKIPLQLFLYNSFRLCYYDVEDKKLFISEHQDPLGNLEQQLFDRYSQKLSEELLVGFKFYMADKKLEEERN